MEHQTLIKSINGNDLSFSINEVKNFENAGIDQIYIYNYIDDDNVKEDYQIKVKKLVSSIDIPVIIGASIKDFEDIKRAIYTGAKAVVIQLSQINNMKIIKEASKRFGKEQLILKINDKLDFDKLVNENLSDYTNNILLSSKMLNEYLGDLIKIKGINLLIEDNNSDDSFDINLPIKGFIVNDINKDDVLNYKNKYINQGYNMIIPKSELPFDDFKVDEKGLIPVIVQEYVTGEVLMLAYMDKESYNITIETGVMTYYSRSRDQLWIKGETSGHYQYLKELNLDCDKDTLIAKVSQAGVACHTGKYSCFYTNLFKKESNKNNPLEVLNDVYNTILDRKVNPQEGSYTNYLFEKGIDKILKKCGEEATEIIIAAKNPNSYELKYEIADFMYHMMVLMVESDLDWNDIINELADRR